MTYSEPESDFNFAFDSKSESDDSKSYFNSVFMNLGVGIFFTLYLQSSK